MSKILLSQGVPSKYDQQYYARLVVSIETQLNGISEGRMAQRYQATATIPTAGNFAVGDIVFNSTPVELAGTGHTYAILGWQCTVAGSPGTLEEMRYLTSDITGGMCTGTVTSVQQALSKDDTETLSGGPVTGSGTLTRTAVDAGADKLIFWDDSADKKTYLTVGSGLSISGTTITASGGGSSSLEVDVSAITSGTAGRILFESATNKLSEDSGFTYDAAANVMDIGTLRLSQTSIISNPTFAGTSITVNAGRLGVFVNVESSIGAADGGPIVFAAGSAGNTSGRGGDLGGNAGASPDGADGGDVVFGAGDAFGVGFNGGNIGLVTGKAFGGGQYGNFQVKNIDNTHILTYDPNSGLLNVETFQPNTTYKSVDGSTGATGTATAANTLTIKNGLITNIA